jgi:hypothetical protein
LTERVARVRIGARVEMCYRRGPMSTPTRFSRIALTRLFAPKRDESRDPFSDRPSVFFFSLSRRVVVSSFFLNVHDNARDARKGVEEEQKTQQTAKEPPFYSWRENKGFLENVTPPPPSPSP